jgi:predicted nucleotidyltransferase
MKPTANRIVKPKQDISVVRSALIELQTALQNTYGSNAPTLLLYGSYSRKEETANSDVDVVLLYPGNIQPGMEIRQLQAVLSALNLRYQILITVLPVSERQYQTSNAAFWQNVRREALPLEQI